MMSLYSRIRGSRLPGETPIVAHASYIATYRRLLVRDSALLVFAAAICSVSFVDTTQAHHGAVTNPGLYRAEELTELEGVITDVFWRNPHPRFRMSVADSDGQATIWELELNGSLQSWGRQGISAESFPGPGESVRAAGYVSRRDPHSLGVLHLLLPNGQEHVNGNRPLRWSNVRMALDGPQVDAEQLTAARRDARSIFRVWGRNADGTGGHPPMSDYVPLLTDRGRELAAAYDPVTQNPELSCRQGMPTTMFDPVPMQIIDSGDRILIRVQEYDVERVVHMTPTAGQAPSSPLGNSVGHWEGDTLIVETAGVAWPYLDPYGTPQSDQVRYRETFALADTGDVLLYSLTVTDPIMFSEPVTLRRAREWTPDVVLETFDCVADWQGAGVVGEGPSSR